MISKKFIINKPIIFLLNYFKVLLTIYSIMKKNISFSFGADTLSPSVVKAKEYLEKIDENIKIYGLINNDGLNWVEIAKKIALDVQCGISNYGIIFCYTGTGVSIVANKFKGIRAALCNDKEIAAGARRWNDANILTMGVLSVKENDVEDIIETWINTDVDSSEMKNIKSISEIEL
tara:strand:+ start:16211 stop:16738 length:528 start_codon:yes stop_codon:yes gene_type:complete